MGRPVQIPSNLVVKPQLADIVDLILQIIGHSNGVHRPCRNRKSRGAVLSTSEGQWATTKFDGVWNNQPYPILAVRIELHLHNIPKVDKGYCATFLTYLCRWYVDKEI